MGGGALSSILQKRAQDGEVVKNRSAAATINHNLDKVKGLGIKIKGPLLNYIKPAVMSYRRKPVSSIIKHFLDSGLHRNDESGSYAKVSQREWRQWSMGASKIERDGRRNI